MCDRPLIGLPQAAFYPYTIYPSDNPEVRLVRPPNEEMRPKAIGISNPTISMETTEDLDEEIRRRQLTRLSTEIFNFSPTINTSRLKCIFAN